MGYLLNLILRKNYKREDCQSEVSNDTNQESLQPHRIGKDEKAYSTVLDVADRLEKKDATNIALTGPYGSGKSSILITLKQDFQKFKFLNISLATLKPAELIIKEEQSDKEGDDVSKQNLDRLIEYSILQQLIYREKQETLPYSRLKRIFHLPDGRVRKISFAVIAAVISIIIVFEPKFLRVEWLCNLLDDKWMNIAGDLICLGYLFWFVFKIISLIIPAISNSRLNKLNLKNGEIEIVKNTSIFNKYLDEILYFFEQTDYNVVILEDLDRFESTDIFLKLRELNLLLNESEVVRRKIFFIYAVRDDMFKNEERVKCFDYITTVIPVINRSNAKSQLKGELEKRGVTEIKEKTLRDIGFFLHDMRLLKNIANEYVQYRNKLETGISADNLLGMIVYKNYYPTDFAKLHDCEGVVYQLLNLKESFVEERIAKLEEENEIRREKQDNYRKERYLRENELRRIYVDAYCDKIGYVVLKIKIGDQFFSLKDISENEKLFDGLISSSRIEYTYVEISTNAYYYSHHSNVKTIPFKDIEQAVNPSLSYKERLATLRTTYEELEEIDVYDIRKDDIRSQSLSQIMKSVDYHSVATYRNLNVPNLIEYLVVNGYIDENYYDYISYFYANFIDAHDWNYILDLKLNKVHPYDFHINNVEACLDEIPNSVYRKNAILNIELVDYFAKHQEDRLHKARLLVMLRTGLDGQKLDFFTEIFKKGKFPDVVFELLFSQFKGMWDVFQKNDDSQFNLKLIWYKYAETEQRSNQSQKWLSDHFPFITDHLQDIDSDQWCNLIRNGDYEFQELNSLSEDIIMAVVDKDSYTLTRRNLEVIVGVLLDRVIDSVSYSLVRQTGHKQLIERVKMNLGFCMKSLFAAPESENETSNTILDILQSTDASDEEKIEYLKTQQGRINLDDVLQNDLKSLALKCDVIAPSWYNVVHYLKNVCDKGTDSEVVDYIERYVDVFAQEELFSVPEEDERMLLQQLIKTNALSFETYKSIVNCFTGWKLKGVPAIEERRVKLLIDKGMFSFNDDNSKDLIAKYSADTVVAYLLKNKSDFLAKPESVSYTTEVALALMKSTLSEREKAIIIQYFDEDIVDGALADEITLILNNNESTLVLSYLLKVMSLTNKFNEKLRVLNYTLEKNDIDGDMVTSLLKTLPDPYMHIAEKGKKPELPNDYESRRLVNLLADRNYISSFSSSKKGIRVNTKLK